MRDDFNKTEWKTFSESLNKFKKECTIDLLNNTAIYISLRFIVWASFGS